MNLLPGASTLLPGSTAVSIGTVVGIVGTVLAIAQRIWWRRKYGETPDRTRQDTRDDLGGE